MKIKYSLKLLKVCSFIFFVFTISNLVKAQSLKGTVTEAESGETIPFANVVVKSGDTIVQGGATDFDGNYNISPLSPGVYSVEASFIGFETYIQDSIILAEMDSLRLDYKLKELNSLENLEIETPHSCWKPQFMLFSSGTVYFSEDINGMPIMR